MKTSTILRHGRVVSAVLLFLALSLAPLHADEFPLFKGKLLGVWKTTVTFGGAVRTTNPDPKLVGLAHADEVPGANGAVSVNDDGNLNFLKGDWISAPLTLMSEINLRANNGVGIFVRARGWYDMALNAKTVHHGNSTTFWEPDAELDDKGWTGSAKFQGVDIYDAFGYGQLNPGSANLQLRVGRQTVNWGEGLLYPGINVVNPVDISWVIMPGATIANAGMLPVGRVYGNLAFTNGFSVDGWYNLEFRSNNYMGCGTYYSPVDDGLQPTCNVAVIKNVPDRVQALLGPIPHYYNGTLPAAGPFPDGGESKPWAKEPEKWNNFGVAGHYFVEEMATEFGVYYAHFTHPAAVVNTIPGPTPADFAPTTEWVEGVQAFAVSASSGIRNMALSGQMTRIVGNPLQRNFPHIIEGGTIGVGPYKEQSLDPANWGQNYPAYFSGNTTQLQLGGTAQIGHFGPFNDTAITAETAMQWVTNHPGLGVERIGRLGNFGVGEFEGLCDDNGLNVCSTDGFGTPFAWGYKLRAIATLPRVSGVTFIPIVSFNNDIVGWGMDGSVQGRVSLGANLRMEIRQRYFADIGANWNRGGTAFDPNRDKGLLTMDFGIRLQ